MYHLGELYDEGLSTPCEDEQRLTRILQEKGAVNLSILAAQKLYFRVDMVLKTNPNHREDLVGTFQWVVEGWKVANRMETFDWDTWRKQALDKYGDGGL